MFSKVCMPLPTQNNALLCYLKGNAIALAQVEISKLFVLFFYLQNQPISVSRMKSTISVITGTLHCFGPCQHWIISCHWKASVRLFNGQWIILELVKIFNSKMKIEKNLQSSSVHKHNVKILLPKSLLWHFTNGIWFSSIVLRWHWLLYHFVSI